MTTRQAYLSCLVSEMILVTYKIDVHPPCRLTPTHPRNPARGQAGRSGDGEYRVGRLVQQLDWDRADHAVRGMMGAAGHDDTFSGGRTR